MMKRSGAAYHQAVRYMAAAGMRRVIVTLEDTDHGGNLDSYPQATTVYYKTGAVKNYAPQKLAELVWRAAQDQHGATIHAVAVAMEYPGSGVQLLPSERAA